MLYTSKGTSRSFQRRSKVQKDSHRRRITIRETRLVFAYHQSHILMGAGGGMGQYRAVHIFCAVPMTTRRASSWVVRHHLPALSRVHDFFLLFGVTVGILTDECWIRMRAFDFLSAGLAWTAQPAVLLGYCVFDFLNLHWRKEYLGMKRSGFLGQRFIFTNVGIYETPLRSLVLPCFWFTAGTLLPLWILALRLTSKPAWLQDENI